MKHAQSAGLFPLNQLREPRTHPPGHHRSILLKLSGQRILYFEKHTNYEYFDFALIFQDVTELKAYGTEGTNVNKVYAACL
jgi:hypothetical protein